MKENTLVQTHPSLIKIIASKNPFWVAASAGPALAFFLWLTRDTNNGWTGVAMFAAGMLYWTFFEYAMHRWPYHTHFKSKKSKWFFESFHLYHHRNMGDHRVLNAGPLMIYPLLLALSLGPYLLLSSRPELLGCFGLGLGLSYVFYEFVHYGIHYRRFESGYMAYIQKYHLHHHYKNWNKNFGNTTHLWDILLGTYDPKYKTFELTEEMESKMIMDSKSLNTTAENFVESGQV